MAKKEIHAWQRSLVRDSLNRYRKALDDYYIKGRPLIETEGGFKAFSLLSPAIGSVVSKRRIRFIMDNIMKQQDAAARGVDIPSDARTPHFITMAITYKCQCNCLHCSASGYQLAARQNKDSLSKKEIIDVIKQTIELGTTTIVLTGGEPFKEKYLCDLIESVDKNKATCIVFTNGEYCNQAQIKRLKKAGVYGVFVSLDFSDPLRHDKNRQRPGIFKKALRAIKLAQEAKILTGISTYITRDKIRNKEFASLMDLARTLGVLEVFIFDEIPVGRLAGQHERLLNEEDFQEIRRLRAYYNSRSDYPRIIHQTMLTSIAYPCTGEGCPAAVAHMHIRANGDITPCDFTPLSFGNIRQKSVKDIWSSMTTHDFFKKPSNHCRLSVSSYWDSMRLQKNYFQQTQPS